ncbi:putative spermidine/putrescine transport system permease protein [Ancylobacter sp. 3268]|uniref:ABC transporter permease n=1 Tax=Ancylobacter sp. 3268 TaxID=2817752 RepID=UPI0028548FFF|nr:ABC transporter permease [Ancylobacter sp. 3268]MDR6952512.1 putative spermidine/putrescine transport system permease protein [Ancylobacter sp. 3268]
MSRVESIDVPARSLPARPVPGGPTLGGPVLGGSLPGADAGQEVPGEPLAARLAWRAWARLAGTRYAGYLLVAPTVLFLAAWFVWPVLTMVHLSLTARVVEGVTVEGFTLENYVRLYASDLYFRILMRTIRIALMTSLLAAAFAYPLAIAIARGGPALARLVTITILAPLLVNVVVRSYGWQTILNKTGALAWGLKLLGISNPPVLLYTEWAVLIACVHVYLPFMVMPIAGAIGRIDRSVEEAARVAGATRLAVLTRVILPLSLPGLAVGVSLVFSLSAAAYVTPQILGGNFSPLLGTLIEQQILTLNDWPFGAAIATLLIAMVLASNLIFLKLVSRRFARWTAGAH